ncbi:small integral membrane protein 14 [Chironomus tepperi]|uniref:small integral membrane protein 14 n=1 Tax=Chironomus tepperi TaxID=113505 RepID=UPI00391F2A74
MGDDQDFDQSLCECIFSHEFAMRRLLNLLRNGQSACTDNECTDLVRPENGSTANDNGLDNSTFLIFMLIATVILYLIRPNSLRPRSTGDTNKHSRDNGPNDENDPMMN